ncbi:serine/threonine-protein kinase [Holophaga foetida]|uniref:serine/threonine-protein kinase n=1 Tax=Holophaga foetida TaxID=35839 RepID=UPI000247260A|nr:serine/threonine-protein kinase [Holophaga foetida]
MELDPLTIGRYHVQREIGSGAMGKVYLAEDPLLKRPVAIKVVHGGAAAQAAALKRFQREAEISAQVNHPNIITVHDVGEESNLGPFLAMEYIEGPSLEEILAKGALAPEHALPLLIQALHALEAAHQVGIIHRDFKPANLLVDQAGRLKLMDFGIARQEDHGLTGSGLLCTPSYADPELLKGSAPSPITDQWAFAATAFQCITGQMPFQGASLSELLYLIAHGEPDLPTSMPPSLRETFRKAFEKEPARRHPDLRTFLRELVGHLDLSEEATQPLLSYLEAPLPTGPISSLATQPLAHGAQRRTHGAMFAGGAVALVVAAGLYLGLRPRQISIRTSPSGARVLADDRPLGRTPLVEISIPRRTRHLRFELEGFLPLDKSLDPQDKTVEVSMERAPVVVKIHSEPQGAEVFLDEVPKGSTPMSALAIPGEGQHRLTLRKPGYESWTMQVSRTRHPPAMIRLRKEAPGWDRGLIKKIFGNS